MATGLTVFLRVVGAGGSLGDVPAERDWSIAEVKRRLEEVFGSPKEEQDLIIGLNRISDDDEVMLDTFLPDSCNVVDLTLLRVPKALKEQRVQKQLVLSKVEAAVADAGQIPAVRKIMEQVQEDLQTGKNTMLVHNAVGSAILACPRSCTTYSKNLKACMEIMGILRGILTCEIILQASVQDASGFRIALEDVFQGALERRLVSQMMASYTRTIRRMDPAAIQPRGQKRRVA